MCCLKMRYLERSSNATMQKNGFQYAWTRELCVFRAAVSNDLGCAASLPGRFLFQRSYTIISFWSLPTLSEDCKPEHPRAHAKHVVGTGCESTDEAKKGHWKTEHRNTPSWSVEALHLRSCNVESTWKITLSLCWWWGFKYGQGRWNRFRIYTETLV